MRKRYSKPIGTMVVLQSNCHYLEGSFRLNENTKVSSNFDQGVETDVKEQTTNFNIWDNEW